MAKWQVEFYTLSDGHASVVVEAECRDEAVGIAAVQYADSFDALISADCIDAPAQTDAPNTRGSDTMSYLSPEAIKAKRAAAGLSATRRQECEYALGMMRRGPYYDHKDHTLRIPHRFTCKRAAEEWRKRGFQHDGKRYEYYRVIPEQHAFGQVAKCRVFFYALYQAYSPNVTPLDCSVGEDHASARPVAGKSCA
jgi:hypothetical protein